MKIVKFIKRYLFSHPLFLFVYILVYAHPGFSQKIRFYDKGQIHSLLQARKSIIRLGDGEVYIMLDTPMEFQTNNEFLRRGLVKIVKNYSHTSDYVLAVPDQIQLSNKALRVAGVKNVWLPFKVMYALIFPKNIAYIDAHMFYPFYDKTTLKHEVLPFLQNKKLIFITKEKTISKLKAVTVFGTDSSYVTTPEVNAIELYDQIKQDILRKSARYSNKKDIVLLFALGPTGKVMAAEFIEEGYQVVDIGKGFDFLLT